MPQQKTTKKKPFQATWAAPVILQGGGVQYSTASPKAIPIPQPKPYTAPRPQTAPQPVPPPVAVSKPASLQWKNPQNGRGWHTGGYAIPPPGSPAPTVTPVQDAQSADVPELGVPVPLHPVGQLQQGEHVVPPPSPTPSTCKWAPTMTSGQQFRPKCASPDGSAVATRPSTPASPGSGLPSPAEKAAQRRAESRARKAEQRASKRMCTPGGLNSNFLGNLCSGLPFCTQSRDQHDRGSPNANAARRAEPNAPWSFGAERSQAEGHFGGWGVPGTNWNFGGNGNGNGGFAFTPPSWTPNPLPSARAKSGGGLFGFGAPPPKPEDEAMIDDLLQSHAKQEDDRGLWSLVTDLFNPGGQSSSPLGSRHDLQLPGSGQGGRHSPIDGTMMRDRGQFSSGDGRSFDDIVDMDVGLGFDGVRGATNLPSVTDPSAAPPSLSTSSSVATTVNMLQHEPDRYTHLSEHDRSAPPEFELNYAEPAPQPDPTQLITGPLPPHPHSLQANGDHAGAAYLVGSDKSLDGMALMDLYEDATRPEENDDAIQDATLPCKTSATGGKSEGGNGSDAVKPPLPVADAPVVDPVEEDVVGSFTLDWRLPTPDASPVIERRGVPTAPAVGA